MYLPVCVNSKKRSEDETQEGLGSLPRNVNSVSSLLLFNTTENLWARTHTYTDLYSQCNLINTDIIIMAICFLCAVIRNMCFLTLWRALWLKHTPHWKLKKRTNRSTHRCQSPRESSLRDRWAHENILKREPSDVESSLNTFSFRLQRIIFMYQIWVKCQRSTCHLTCPTYLASLMTSRTALISARGLLHPFLPAPASRSCPPLAQNMMNPVDPVRALSIFIWGRSDF